MIYSDYKLKIGVNDCNENIEISMKNCFFNTLVLGNKGTCKSELILSEFAYQTILDKNVGGTFIVSSKDISFKLYLLAKQFKRRTMFINPSVSLDVDNVMSTDNFSKEHIESVFNFEKYIYNNYIVIVDAENILNSKNRVNFITFLMESFTKAFLNSKETCLKPHFLYVDDAFDYLDPLKNILYYGHEYNIGTTLFFQNRGQFMTHDTDYTDFLDSNISNIILTNELTLKDKRFYEEMFEEKLYLSSKSIGDLYYSLRTDEGKRVNGNCKIEKHEDLLNISKEDIYSTKKSLVRKKEKKKEAEIKKSVINQLNCAKDIKVQEKDIVETTVLKVSEDIKTIENFVQKETLNDIMMDTKEDTIIDTKEDINYIKEDIKDAREDIKNLSDDGKIELTLDWDDDNDFF